MELWSKAHIQTLLPATVVMVVVALILRKLLGGREWKIRMIPFQVLAVIMVLLEIGKQVISVINGYDLYHLLFHFCSLVVIMIPVMAFYRGKHQQKVNAITASLLASVVLLMLIYPALIYSEGNIQAYFGDFFSFHTVTFHNLALLAFFLVIALDLYTPTAQGEPKVLVVYMLCFCVVSATMAQLLKTNFNNFYSCNVPPLEELRVNLQGVLGYGVTQTLYVLIVTVLDILFVQMSYWMTRYILRFTQRKKTEMKAEIR